MAGTGKRASPFSLQVSCSLLCFLSLVRTSSLRTFYAIEELFVITAKSIYQPFLGSGSLTVVPPSQFCKPWPVWKSSSVQPGQAWNRWPYLPSWTWTSDPSLQGHGWSPVPLPPASTAWQGEGRCWKRSKLAEPWSPVAVCSVIPYIWPWA